MKQIIFALAFIYCVFCAGPAYNVQNRAYGECNLTLYSASDNDLSMSDCVDQDLYYSAGKYYFDKCCYIRYRKEGEMLQGCIGLNREQFMDVPETIRRMEKGDKLLNYDAFKDSKIYELNCNSCYLKICALGFALISLLF